MRKYNLVLYIISLAVYVASLIYNVSVGSTWWIDASLSIVFLTAMFLLSRWLRMGKLEFSLLNLGLLLHNLGTFGFYEWSYGWLGYDNIIHFTCAAITAFIAANFIHKRLSFKLRLRKKDDTKILTGLIVLGIVMLLGAGIELLEYVGYSVLDIEGSGVGVLGVGSANEYLDTMNDILTNLIGAIVGVFAYYLARH